LHERLRLSKRKISSPTKKLKKTKNDEQSLSFPLPETGADAGALATLPPRGEAPASLADSSSNLPLNLAKSPRGDLQWT
jgi:hypothetical protein